MLVAMAILGIVLAGTATFIADRRAQQEDLKDRMDLNITKAHFLSFLDCKKSLPLKPSTACTAKPYIGLSSTSRLLLPASGGMGAPFGKKLRLRASCQTSPDRIRVEYLVTRQDGSPLSGATWQELFPNLNLCAADFADPEDTELRDIDCPSPIPTIKAPSFQFSGSPHSRAVKGSSSSWGIECLSPYKRFSCVISSNAGGGNITYSANGCRTDSEAYSNAARMQTLCCKVGDMQ